MNWQFHNYRGLNSATRAYGINESVDQQNGAIFSFAEKHQLNLPFTNFFEAKSEIRKPFFERTRGKYLLKELEAGNYGQLIVTRFELLGKTPLQIKDTIGKFTAHGVVLHILDLAGMEFSIGSQVGKMIEHLIDWAAAVEEKYVRKDSEHTESIQDALDKKRDAGLLTGSEPYGWNAIETGESRVNSAGKTVKIRRLEPNVEEQKWILHMARLHDLGWSYHAIAIELNRLKVRTKRGVVPIKMNGRQMHTSGKWKLGLVAKVLNSKTVQQFLTSRPAA